MILCQPLICIFVLSPSIRSPHTCYRQWFHRVRHFSVWVSSALLALGTSVRGPNCIICMCVYVYVCVCLCVFSVLVHQHLRPLIMTVMICQQMTYTPKKTFSFQRQLLFATILPPSFLLLLSRLKHFLLSPHSNSLYLSINVIRGFPLILALSASPVFWPRPVIGGRQRG